MCATFGGEYLDRLCRTLCCVTSCHQFRTGRVGHNIDQATRRCIWRGNQQLHLRGLGWIMR